MRKRNLRLFLMTTMFFIMTSALSFAEEVDVAAQNAARFGFWTLIPPLVAISLAFITKNVIVSLVIGIMSGGFILNIVGNNPFMALFYSFLDLVNRAVASLADPWNAGIILQVLAIGGVINLVGKMGGAKAIAEALSKRAKSAKSAQMMTWFAGLLVFFDDYANSLIIGPMMRPVTDKMKISRERLAFIIDATAAPVAGIAIISTWIGLEVGLIGSAFESIGVEANPFGVFLSTIPFRFYNILILAFIVITALLLKDFGPMRKAELACRRGNQNLTSNEDVNKELSKHDELEPLPNVKLSVWNAIIPIGALIVGALFAFYYSGYTTIMGGENTSCLLNKSRNVLCYSNYIGSFNRSDIWRSLFTNIRHNNPFIYGCRM